MEIINPEQYDDQFNDETFDDMLHREAFEMALQGYTQGEIDEYVRGQEEQMRDKMLDLYDE